MKRTINRYVTLLNDNVQFRKIVANSGWLFFEKFIKLFLGAIVGIWVARYLGPENYGELAYTITWIAFFQAVSKLGLDGIVVRDIAKNENKADVILGSAFYLRIGSGVFSFLMALGVLWAYGDTGSVFLVFVAGGSLIFQASDTIDLWFQSQSQSKRTVIAKLIAYGFSNIIRVVLIVLEAPLWTFALVLLIDALVVCIGLVYAYSKFRTKNQWKYSHDIALELLKESWPFMLSGLSIMIYMRVDQVMLKAMLDTKQLGIYAAVLPLSTLWQFIPVTLSTSLAPYISRKKQEGEREYLAALSNVFRLFSLLGWLICIPTVLLSQHVVNLLYGDEYSSGAVVLIIHVFTNIFINLGVAQNLWLLNEGLGKLSLYRTIIGVIVCIVGNYIMIPRYGIAGAAYIAVLAQMASSFLSNLLFAPKIFKMQVKSLILMK